MRIYTVREFANEIGVVVKTLQRWERTGRLVPAARSPGNRRLYTEEQLQQILGERQGEEKQPRLRVAYARVTSQAQRPDLRNQQTALEQFCIAQGIAIDEWLSEVGGGMNFRRPKFLSLIDRIVAGQIEVLVIAHKDRLARFGFELLSHLCETHDCRLVILNVESLSPEQEMVQDLMTITHCFSARLYGLRNYRKALKDAVQSDTARTQDQA